MVKSDTKKAWRLALANAEEVEPDEIDLAMLKEIEENPECHEFVSREEMMKELNIE